ncbi:MAG: hypothetical protein ACYTFG_05145 [Planctomycetota bacterium]
MVESEDRGPIVPPEIHFRVDESLSRSPQFLVKTTSGGDLLFKFFDEAEAHYHLGLRFKGTDNGAVSLFLIRTLEKPKKHETLVETMPVCTADLKAWRAWLSGHATGMTDLLEKAAANSRLVSASELELSGREYTRVSIPREFLKRLEPSRKKLIIDDALVSGALGSHDSPPLGVLFFDKEEDPDVAMIAVPSSWAAVLTETVPALPRPEGEGPGEESYWLLDLAKLTDALDDFLAWVLEGAVRSFRDKGIREFIGQIQKALEESRGGKHIDLETLLGVDFEKLIRFEGE